MPIYEYKCQTCGRIFDLLIRTGSGAQQPRCKYCDSEALKRLISRPGLIRSQSRTDSGELRPVDPRKAVEHMSRMYDKSGLDPGQGFSEVAKRAAAGDSPETLKEAVKEARQKEAKTQSAKSEQKSSS
jgi:putative FmdB family regulatory protein